MGYQPKVAAAKIVGHNPKNGLMEISAELKDRTVCRIIYEKDASGSFVPTHINRLQKEPCPICRKDYLCNCMQRFIDDISAQSLEQTGLPE